MPPKTKVRKNLDTTHNSATYVVLLKENHMQLTEAASLGRKSGGAEGSAVSLYQQPMRWVPSKLCLLLGRKVMEPVEGCGDGWSGRRGTVVVSGERSDKRHRQ
jgi:hypothetical protein